MRLSFTGGVPGVMVPFLAVGVAAAVGFVLAATAEPIVVAVVGLTSGAVAAVGMARSEAARRSVLMTVLAFSFVMSRWQVDTGFIVLEPWLLVLPVYLFMGAAHLALKRDLVRLDAVGVLALLVVLTAWLSLIDTVDVVTCLKRAGKITLLFGLYLLLVNWVSERRHLAAFLRAVFLSCVVVALGIFVELFLKWRIAGTIDVFGSSGTFRNANESATYLAVFVMFLLALYAWGVHREVLNRPALLASLLLIGTGVLLTRSRTGVICAVAVPAMLFIRTPRARRLVLGAGAVLVVLALMPFTQVVVDRLLATVGLSPNPGVATSLQRGNTERLYLLEVYWTVVKAYPVFGIGAGSYGFIGSLPLVMPIPPPELQQPMERMLATGFRTNAHNGFISWWVQAGTLGFAPFVASLFYGVFALARACRRWTRRQNGDRWWYAIATASMGGLVVFMLTNLTGDFGVSEIRYWLLLAFTSVSLRGLQQAGGAGG